MKKKTLTYMKRIVMFILINAVLWVWCSYALAFLGRYEIAESLSETAVTSVIATILTYGIKSTVEKISEYGFVGKIKNEKKKNTKKDC